MVEHAQIIAGVSLVFGVLLLIASSIFLDDWREVNDACKKPFNCKQLRYWVAGASFGIIAALIQIGCGVLGFLKKWKLWCIVHVVIFLAAIIAFSLPISEHADDIPNFQGYQGGSRAKFFLAWSAIDFIFAFFAAGAVFFLTKQS